MRSILSIAIVFLYITSTAQQPEDVYKKPLKEVLKEVENRYNVKVVYDSKSVKDQVVNYAQWRFRNNAETTLNYILAPLDLFFDKTGNNTYQVRKFDYYRRLPQEGKEHLDRLLSLYSNTNEWEKRKTDLTSCLYSNIGLSPMPKKTPLNPILSAKRTMDGYTVQNIAIESIPGVYVTGSLYKPLKTKGKLPAVLLTQGHGPAQHFSASSQLLSAGLARMGAIVFNYDMFAQGESGIQIDSTQHRTGLSMTMQALNGMRVIDYLTSLPDVDPKRIAITGHSGGGTQDFLITALDKRIAVSVPVVMVSSWFYGGCPCESGLPVHSCGPWGTNNVEIAALAAPRPMLVVSDGGDWTANVPEIEFPYIKKIYGFYGKQELVQNAHFPTEGHDYGISKRTAAYNFLAQHLGLNINAIKDVKGNIDESKCTVEPRSVMLSFGEKGEKFPASSIRDINSVRKKLESLQR